MSFPSEDLCHKTQNETNELFYGTLKNIVSLEEVKNK